MRGAFTTPQGATLYWRVVPIAALHTLIDETIDAPRRRERLKRFLRRHAVAVHPTLPRVLLALPSSERDRIPPALRSDPRFRDGWTADWSEIVAANPWVEAPEAQSESRHLAVDADLGEELRPDELLPEGDPSDDPPPEDDP